MRQLIAPIVFACALSQAGAALKFATSEVEVKAKPADSEVTAEFRFKNNGDQPIDILQVSYACSCLSAETDKERYEPGEAGVLKADFRLGSFTGLQRKAITVLSRADGGKEDGRDRLMVAVRIPDVITVEPQLMQWMVGDEPTEKSFTFKVPHEEPIHIKEIACSREGFEIELVEKKPGREYEIKVKPAGTERPMLGVVRIETDCDIPKHQKKLAFFSIARARKAPK